MDGEQSHSNTWTVEQTKSVQYETYKHQPSISLWVLRLFYDFYGSNIMWSEFIFLFFSLHTHTHDNPLDAFVGHQRLFCVCQALHMSVVTWNHFPSNLLSITKRDERRRWQKIYVDWWWHAFGHTTNGISEMWDRLWFYCFLIMVRNSIKKSTPEKWNDHRWHPAPPEYIAHNIHSEWEKKKNDLSLFSSKRLRLSTWGVQRAQNCKMSRERRTKP